MGAILRGCDGSCRHCRDPALNKEPAGEDRPIQTARGCFALDAQQCLYGAPSQRGSFNSTLCSHSAFPSSLEFQRACSLPERVRPDVSRTRLFASPCIRSSLAARNHDSACTERPSIRRTHLRFGADPKHCSGHVHPSREAKAPSSLQHNTLRNHPRLHEAPQRHDQACGQQLRS